MAHEFTSVTLEAEHVPETWLVDGVHGSGQTQELPGSVNVYLVFDGARLLFTQLKAGKVFDAIEQSKQKQAEQSSSSGQ